MKGKVFLIVIFSLLLIISISQIFTIPPYSRNVFSYYKSGYFNELEKSSKIISHAFFTLMTTRNKSAPWVYLREIDLKTGINSKLFDSSGRYIISTGEKNLKVHKGVKNFLSGSDSDRGFIENGRYGYFLRIDGEKKCLICHRNRKTGEKMGVFYFDHPVKGYIYYSSERIILFVFISIILSLILFMVFRWDPEKNIKELFDKYE